MPRPDLESSLVATYGLYISQAHWTALDIGTPRGVVINRWSATPETDTSPRAYLDGAFSVALGRVSAADVDSATDPFQLSAALEIALLQALIRDLRFSLFNQSENGKSQSLSDVIKGLVDDLDRLTKRYDDVYPIITAASFSGAIGGHVCPSPWVGRDPSGCGYGGAYGRRRGCR